MTAAGTGGGKNEGDLKFQPGPESRGAAAVAAPHDATRAPQRIQARIKLSAPRIKLKLKPKAQRTTSPGFMFPCLPLHNHPRWWWIDLVL